MIKDKVLVGIIVGLLADVIKLLVNYTAYILNFTSVVFWQITATRFLEKNALFKPVAYFIGGVADITISALLGVAFIYLIYFVGKSHLWIKGIGFGLAVWVMLFGTLLSQVVQQKLPQNPTGIVVTIIAHFAFGLALAFFAGLLLKSSEQHTHHRTIKYHLSPSPAKKQDSQVQKIRFIRPKKL